MRFRRVATRTASTPRNQCSRVDMTTIYRFDWFTRCRCCSHFLHSASRRSLRFAPFGTKIKHLPGITWKMRCLKSNAWSDSSGSGNIVFKARLLRDGKWHMAGCKVVDFLIISNENQPVRGYWVAGGAKESKTVIVKCKTNSFNYFAFKWGKSAQVKGCEVDEQSEARWVSLHMALSQWLGNSLEIIK